MFARKHLHAPHRGRGRTGEVLSRRERGGEGASVATRAGDVRSAHLLRRERHADFARSGTQRNQVRQYNYMQSVSMSRKDVTYYVLAFVGMG